MHGALVEILVLLASALALGMLAERLKQSAILGYLAAGTLVGPNVLGWVDGGQRIDLLAELGASLLLFTIGLEFSLTRLKQLGTRVLVAGVLQIVFTTTAGAAAAMAFGLSFGTAFALGSIFALSSTAVVARLLVESRTLDSTHGRQAMGVLLVQDIAVVPIVLALAFGRSGGDLAEISRAALSTLLYATILIASFVLFVRVIVPYGLGAQAMTRNRDLPVVFALVCALGSVVGAELAGLPPALGAFVAGVLLGGSRFAAQIRADVAPLYTLLLTVFFAAIGLAGDPLWAYEHAPLVLATLAAVVAGKALIAAGALRVAGLTGASAFAAAATISQIGEFSFVVAGSARSNGFSEGFLDDTLFRLVVTVTVASLALAPLMVATANRFARARVEKGRDASNQNDAPTHASRTNRASDIIIVGFGPAGREAYTSLTAEMRASTRVLESSAHGHALARSLEIECDLGDARRREALEHAGIMHARVLLIAVSDPAVVASITALAHAIAPTCAVIARARYHVAEAEISEQGATQVVDEELLVGRMLSAAAMASINRSSTTARGA
jgi:CPA2 family monovalent cation:H+ antiporter-2